MHDAPECPTETGGSAAMPDPAWQDKLDRDMRHGFAVGGLPGSYAALNRALGWP